MFELGCGDFPASGHDHRPSAAEVAMKQTGTAPGVRTGSPWLGVLRFVIRAIDGINERVGRAVSWLALVLVLITAYDVLMRYLFRTSYVFIAELEWHLFAILFLVGAGYTYLHDGHVRVDIFYAQTTPRRRALIDVIFTVFFLFPMCIMLVRTSLPFVGASWAVLEGSPDPGGLPGRFLVKAAIPVGFLFLALQGVSELIKKLFILLGREDELGIARREAGP
jgi:TRAP-type mannitol/chloroaromatic compound transport system permease small subunit